VHDPEVAVTV
jgi:hypothetical protein